MDDTKFLHSLARLRMLTTDVIEQAARAHEWYWVGQLNSLVDTLDRELMRAANARAREQVAREEQLSLVDEETDQAS